MTENEIYNHITGLLNTNIFYNIYIGPEYISLFTNNEINKIAIINTLSNSDKLLISADYSDTDILLIDISKLHNLII